MLIHKYYWTASTSRHCSPHHCRTKTAGLPTSRRRLHHTSACRPMSTRHYTATGNTNQTTTPPVTHTVVTTTHNQCSTGTMYNKSPHQFTLFFFTTEKETRECNTYSSPELVLHVSANQGCGYSAVGGREA